MYFLWRKQSQNGTVTSSEKEKKMTEDEARETLIILKYTFLFSTAKSLLK